MNNNSDIAAFDLTDLFKEFAIANFATIFNNLTYQ
jgi:hypothetical protein